MAHALSKDELTEARLLAALDQPVELPRPSLAYRVMMAATVGVIVLLPLIYLALVAASGWATVWWATHGWELTAVAERPKNHLMLYLAPLLIGAVLTFFLCKPLLAKHPEGAEPLVLDPEAEPRLFAYLDRLCEAVGAPVPHEVHVDLQVNASAHLSGGWAGLFRRRMVLTIGLPLVACMDLGQLTSVLCHEFGHFSQGVGMRSYQVLWRVQRWFAVAAYGRDSWDGRLARAAEVTPGFLAFAFLFARLFVWLTRAILKGLLKLSQLLGASLSRQMEFDADGHAFGRVGAETFAASMQSLSVVELANNWAFSDVNQAFSEGRLGDDLPAIITANLEQLPDAARAQAMASALDGTPDMYASHPPTGVRIERAMAAGAADRLGLDAAACDLFDHWEELSREATLDHYRAVLGSCFDPGQLVESDAVVQEGLALQAQRSTAARWFRDLWESFLLPDFSNVELPDVLEGPAATERQAALRTALLASEEQMTEAQASAWQARRAWLSALDGGTLLRAGRKVDEQSFGVSEASTKAFGGAAREARASYQQGVEVVRGQWRRAAARTAAALASRPAAVAESGSAAAALLTDEERARGVACMAFLAALALRADLVEDLWLKETALGTLVDRLAEDSEDEGLQEAARSSARGALELLQQLREVEGDWSVPFQSQGQWQQRDVRELVFPELGKTAELPGLQAAIGQVTHRLYDLSRRCQLELASLGEAAEAALGLEPLDIEATAEAGIEA